MQVNPVPAEKLIALKLHGLNWFDRRWMLAKLEREMQQKVKRELAQLKQMKVQNAEELLAQITGSDGAPALQDKSNAPGQVDEFGFSAAVKDQLVALSSDGGQTALQLRKAVVEYMTTVTTETGGRG